MAGFGSSIKLTGESEYQRALKQINQSLREVGSEMKIVSSSFDKNDKSTQAMAQKSDVLNKKLEEQKNKLSVLTQKYNEMNATYGKNSTAQKELTAELTKEKAKLDEIGSTLGKTSKEYQEQQKVVNDLENKQTSYNNAVSKAKTEMNLAQAEVNKTTKELDELGKETQDVEQKVKGAGDGFTVFKGILSNLGTQAINGVVNGLKSVGKALIDVGKQAISSYGDFEQLEGGVKSMFGGMEKGSTQINKVLGLSKNAWKDLTMSQNDYITAFNSTYPLMKNDIEDQNEAIEKTNRIMTLNSDLANTFGYSMEEASNAVNWALKGTFSYLDNLNIGIKGTKEGFLEAAKSVGYTVKSVDELSSSDILDILEKCADRYGVLGKTADEANQTIQGSTKMVKASWENLLTGLADGNQEMGPLIQNFVDSVAIAWENLKPRIRETIDGIKQAIGELWNKRAEIKEEFPELAPIINAMEWIIKNKDLVIGGITAIIGAMAIGKIASFITTMVTLGTTLAGIPAVAGLASTAMTMLGGAFTFMTGPIGIAIMAIGAVVGAFVLLWNKSEAFKNFWIGLWEGIKNIVSTAVDTIVKVFNTVVDFIKNNWQNILLLLVNPFAGAFKLLYDNCEGFREFIDNLVTNIVTTISTFATNVKNKAIEIGTNFVNNIINFFTQLPSKIWNLLTQVITKVVTFAKNIGAKASEAGQNVVNNIINKIKNLPSQMINWGKDMIQGLINGIKSMIGKVGDAVSGVANKIKKLLHFSRPDEGPLREYESWMPDFIQGLSNSLDKSSPELINQVKQLANDMSLAMQPNLALNGLNTSNNSISGINTQMNYDYLVEAFTEALEGVKIELDDEEVGTFVKKTVENAIYT